MKQRRYLAIVLLALLALGAAVALGTAAPGDERSSLSEGPIVLLSGRDDHGLQQLPEVPLQRSPDDTTEAGRLRDGTFVRVVEDRGDWKRVQSLESPQISGWVNDFYLRNRALRRDGGGQVVFAGAEMRDAVLVVAVRPVTDTSAAPIWLPAAQLVEVGARETEDGHDHGHDHSHP